MKNDKNEIEEIISARGAKDNAPSISFFYGEKIRKDTNVAVRVNGGLLYRWEECFWNAQEHAYEVRKARDWIDSVAPSKSAANAAEELAKTAIQKAMELPDRNGEVCIPVKNVYLHLERQEFPSCEVEDDEGNLKTIQGGVNHVFRVEEPSKESGMTYVINCDLKDLKIGSYYMPKVDISNTLFGKYLEKCQPDPAVRELLQEFAAYTLLPDTRYAVACMMIGEGSNGKSTFMDILKGIHRKVSTLDLNDLDGFHMEDAVDASLIIVDEVPDKINQAASNRWKSIVDGRQVKIDRKFKTVMSTPLYAKWVVSANTPPITRDASHGYWRRWITIPWEVEIKDEEKIHNLEKRILTDERHIVLEWALEGLLRLLDRGRFAEQPEPVQRLKQEIRAATDTVRGWVKSCEIEMDVKEETSKDDIWIHYQKWCEESGHFNVAKNKFFSRLLTIFPEAKDLEKYKRSAAGRWRTLPIRLDPIDRADDDDDGGFEPEPKKQISKPIQKKF